MKIKWKGHSAFLIESPKGLRILTDPFDADVPYPKIDEIVDVVTVSHEHHDHNAVNVLRGDFKVLSGLDETPNRCIEITETVGDVVFRTIPSYHDDGTGRKRGHNGIFVMDFGGFTIAHLGDLGHIPSDDTLKKIGKINILMIPVGGYYTIDGQSAKVVTERIDPNVAIPMHYKTRYIDSWPISSVDSFLEGQTNVVRIPSDEVEFDPNAITGKREIWVFQI